MSLKPGWQSTEFHLTAAWMLAGAAAAILSPIYAPAAAIAGTVTGVAYIAARTVAKINELRALRPDPIVAASKQPPATPAAAAK